MWSIIFLFIEFDGVYKTVTFIQIRLIQTIHFNTSCLITSNVKQPILTLIKRNKVY